MAWQEETKSVFITSECKGLIVLSKTGQIYSSVLRPATVPHVLPVLRDQQYGAKAGGGTEFPIMIRRFFFKWAKKEGISAAGLFCDLRKAFYSVLPEEALGPLITADERAELLQAFGFSPQQIADFTNLLLFSGGLLYEAGVPEDLLEALNQWHKATWYTFEDQETYHVHSLGVKPGDTLADDIFAICFVTFHKKVVRTLEEEGLIVTIEIPTPTVFTPPAPLRQLQTVCLVSHRAAVLLHFPSHLAFLVHLPPSSPLPCLQRSRSLFCRQHFVMIVSSKWLQKHRRSCWTILLKQPTLCSV